MFSWVGDWEIHFKTMQVLQYSRSFGAPCPFLLHNFLLFSFCCFPFFRHFLYSVTPLLHSRLLDEKRNFLNTESVQKHKNMKNLLNTKSVKKQEKLQKKIPLKTGRLYIHYTKYFEDTFKNSQSSEDA